MEHFFIRVWDDLVGLDIAAISCGREARTSPVSLFLL